LPTPAIRNGGVRIAIGTVAAGLPFLAYSFFILDHFYRAGALLNDAGYIAHMMFDGGPALLVGKAVFIGNPSFYAFHVTPLFAVTSAVARFVPLTVPQWFALYAGISHALLTVGVFWFLTGPCRMRSPGPSLLAGLVALGFGFNGVAIGMIKFPHFEILIPAAMILFLIAWSQGRVILATSFFALSLAVREDVGFQIAALLIVLMALDRWRGVAGREKATPAFIAAGLVYSAATVAVQRLIFPDTSLLIWNYLGQPPFAHLSWQLVATRFFGYFIYRSYIMLPMLCAIVWAIVARNPYIVVGYIAFLPWFLLQMLAVNDAIGTIPYHYAYPFIVAMFWPLIAMLLAARRGNRPLNPRSTLIGFTVMLISSLGVGHQANPSGADLGHAFFSIPSFSEERAVDYAVHMLNVAHGELGRVVAEDGVAALAADDFTKRETFWSEPPPRSADTVIYFPHGYRAASARELIAAAALKYRYVIVGTPIRLTTNRSLEQMPILAPLLAPAP
jgi:hypothetical protein